MHPQLLSSNFDLQSELKDEIYSKLFGIILKKIICFLTILCKVHLSLIAYTK